jgi:rubrerythrin
MSQLKDAEAITRYLQSLSGLENKAFLLYHTLAEKVEIPLAKSLLESIAQDSLKHSRLIKGVSDRIMKVEEKSKDYPKRLGKVWATIDVFSKRVAAIERIAESDFLQMVDALSVLESTFGEEYFILVQMKTMELLWKEINQRYNVDLQKMAGVFESIVNDEDHHRELLVTIKELFTKNEPKAFDNTPFVKYQNPDSWAPVT